MVDNQLTETAQTCGCDFDPAYHREFNEGRSGSRSPKCFNPADPDTGLCTPCLFGCAP
jgi:hypothetical protein